MLLLRAGPRTPSRGPPGQALADVDFGRSERAVRVNSVQSGHCQEDLEAVLTGAALPDALVVPKVGARCACCPPACGA